MYDWITIANPSDWAKLGTLLSQEFQPDAVVDKLKDTIAPAVANVLVEHGYADKDYRSTYYNFYAKKGQQYGIDCVRLHLFDKGVSFDSSRLALDAGARDNLSTAYFGYMVLRPTRRATIGRTVLSPRVRQGAQGYVITARHKVHLLGYDLVLEGFPSMDQHSDISVCAHVACWAILRHYSERFPRYAEYLTYEITRMAHPFDPGGLVPSRGLRLSHAERVFQAAGTFPYVVVKTIGKEAFFYRQLLAYIESGLPLFAAMDKQEHAIAAIGFDWNAHKLPTSTQTQYAWDAVGTLLVVDDNHLPYCSVKKVGPPIAGKGNAGYTVGDISAFIVALPEKIFYPAAAVDEFATRLLGLPPMVGLPKPADAVIRYFVTTGATLRREMRRYSSQFDVKLLDVVMKLPMRQFVWVIEYAAVNEWNGRQVAVRAIVDATANLYENNPLWLLYDTKSAVVFPRGREEKALAIPFTGAQGRTYGRMEPNLRNTAAM